MTTEYYHAVFVFTDPFNVSHLAELRSSVVLAGESCPIKKCYYKSREYGLCLAFFEGTSRKTYNYTASKQLCEDNHGRLSIVNTKNNTLWVARFIQANTSKSCSITKIVRMSMMVIVMVTTMIDLMVVVVVLFLLVVCGGGNDDGGGSADGGCGGVDAADENGGGDGGGSANGGGGGVDSADEDGGGDGGDSTDGGGGGLDYDDYDDDDDTGGGSHVIKMMLVLVVVLLLMVLAMMLMTMLVVVMVVVLLLMVVAMMVILLMLTVVVVVVGKLIMMMRFLNEICLLMALYSVLHMFFPRRAECVCMGTSHFAYCVDSSRS